MHGFNLKIKRGETVALVGNSGNGKSTCLQLLQRFYDPNKGEVFLDDRNLRSLNIHSLRSCIATVGQEPVLFSTTIGENIRYGRPNATNDEIIAAAKNSGAHTFIMELTKGYDTLLGGSGSQLSGGQKQRIAIARALVQNPKILLLDEATSALDYQSEKYIQETLDSASKDRTTIVVSHRLSAIKGADRLLFIEKGRIVEEGTHEELFELKGKYYDMVKSEDLNDEIKKSHLETKPNSPKKPALSHKESQDEQSDEAQSNDWFIKEAEQKQEISNEDIQYMKNFIRILRLAKADWKILAIAVTAAFIVGSAFPLFAVVFAEVFGILSYPNTDEALKEVFTWCMVFLGLGVFIFIGALNQTFCFTKAGANLTQRVRYVFCSELLFYFFSNQETIFVKCCVFIRSITFEAMFKQECGWFDDHNNSVGALGSRLTGDAANLQTVHTFLNL